MGGNTGAIAGAAGAAFLTGGGSLLFNAAALGAGAFVGSQVGKMLEGPEVPDAPKVEAPVDRGDEGIRRGEADRLSKRRALGQIHLTRGQSRDTGSTLGAQRQKLG